MDVAGLLNQIGQQVDYVNQRRAVADEARASYDAEVAAAKASYDAVVERGRATLEAASQDQQKAEGELQSLRDQLNTALGGMLEPKNSRVTISR